MRFFKKFHLSAQHIGLFSTEFFLLEKFSLRSYVAQELEHFFFLAQELSIFFKTVLACHWLEILRN